MLLRELFACRIVESGRNITIARQEKRENGVYIPKKNEKLVRRLAQKSYDEKVLRLAEKRLFQIQRITRDYDDEEIEKIFLNEHRERQKLIQPIEPIWEQQLQQWMAKEYKGKGFREGTPVISLFFRKQQNRKSMGT